MFLDRDGVLNRTIVRDGRPYPPVGIGQLVLEIGAAKAVSLLKSMGFDLLVVTNQPDVARGSISRESVEQIDRALAAQLPIDRFLVCFHDDQDGCACRKPAPGLLLKAAAQFGIDLGRSFMVGDRWKDIAAGKAAGVTTVFIDRSYDEPAPMPPADFTALSTLEAAEWIVRQG